MHKSALSEERGNGRRQDAAGLIAYAYSTIINRMGEHMLAHAPALTDGGARRFLSAGRQR